MSSSGDSREEELAEEVAPELEVVAEEPVKLRVGDICFRRGILGRRALASFAYLPNPISKPVPTD